MRAIDLAAAPEEAAECELQLDRLRILLRDLQERLDRLVRLLLQQEVEAPEYDDGMARDSDSSERMSTRARIQPMPKKTGRASSHHELKFH
jgi:hypothetical protein